MASLSYTSLFPVFLCVLASLSSSCEVRDASVVSGTVALSSRMPLPEGGILLLRIVNNHQKGETSVLVEKRIVLSDPVPEFAFALPYEKEAVHANHTYTLQASLMVGGQLTHFTHQQPRVLEKTSVRAFDLVLHPM